MKTECTLPSEAADRSVTQTPFRPRTNISTLPRAFLFLFFLDLKCSFLRSCNSIFLQYLF